MAIKRHNPTTPSQRFLSTADFSNLTKKRPEKSLLAVKNKRAGRNGQGKITVRHRGGGNRQKYRVIDFKRNHDNVPAKVEALEYDPNRTANIALLHYADGLKSYILAPVGLNVGDKVMSGEGIEVKVGNSMPLKDVPVGSVVHNVELRPNQGAVIARSAGISARLMAKEGKYATLKMPSGEMRLVLLTCRATLGQVGNVDHEIISIGKAGRNRHMGKRPSVRGVVMNPCDHPHGGGEGKSPVGMAAPVTPWGKPALGLKTRNKKKSTNKFIISSRS